MFVIEEVQIHASGYIEDSPELPWCCVAKSSIDVYKSESRDECIDYINKQLESLEQAQLDGDNGIWAITKSNHWPYTLAWKIMGDDECLETTWTIKKL